MHSCGVEANFKKPPFEQVVIVLEYYFVESSHDIFKSGIKEPAYIIIQLRKHNIIALCANVTYLWFARYFTLYFR